MKKWLLLVLGLLQVCGVSVLSQITISSNTFQPIPGTIIDYYNDAFADEALFISMSSGLGGPMTWDFSSRTYSGMFTNYSVDPMTTPSIDSFPSGNIVLLQVVGNDSSWTVYNSIASSYTHLGTVAHAFGNETITKYEDYTPEYTFPLNYGDSWVAYRHWSMTSSSSYTLSFDTVFYEVDAWGTAIYNSNSVPCLRVISERRATLKTYDLSDNLLDSNTTYTTNVILTGEGFNQIVGVSKTNFMGIEVYGSSASKDFIDIPTDVAEVRSDVFPDGFELSQNYPNPFNPSTEIRLSLPKRGHITMTVYDILGREVAILLDKEMSAGVYTVDWDGRTTDGQEVSSGIYFYRFKVDNFCKTKKMLLMK